MKNCVLPINSLNFSFIAISYVWICFYCYLCLFVMFVLSFADTPWIDSFFVVIFSLQGYSLIISHTLSTYNRSIQKRIEAAEPSGMFSSMTKLVGNMFVASDETHVNAVKYAKWGVRLWLKCNFFPFFFSGQMKECWWRCMKQCIWIGISSRLLLMWELNIFFFKQLHCKRMKNTLSRSPRRLRPIMMLK